MLQRNFGFKTKLDIVWPSDFSPSYHVWAAELGTTRVFTASRTRIVAAVSKYGEHAWDYVIISWRHNLGATFLYFMFAKCSICSMKVEDCVISKICNGNSIMVNTVMLENYKVNCWDIWLLCNLIIICNGNSIMVNTVMLENYKVNCWDIWLLCNIDGTGPLCLGRPTL